MKIYPLYRRASLVALLLASVSHVSIDARAQGKKKGAAALPSVDLAAISAKLKSGDPAEIKAGLEAAGAAGKGAATLSPTIEDFLRRGVSTELVTASLQTLGALGVEKSSAAIKPYARHRNVDLRRAAERALLKTGGKDAIDALREGLSDSDPIVRGTAASGLGALKAKEAIPDLFLALDHKVDEAAASIGQLCALPECEKFAGKVGAIGFDVMTSGFDQILFRPVSDMTDDEKIRIVGRLRELGTGEANRYLRDVQSRWTPGTSPRVKQAIDQAVLATGGSASPTPGGPS